MHKTYDNDTFYSLAELVDAAEKYGVEMPVRYRTGEPKSGNVTWSEALALGRKGWDEQLDSALDLAESAIVTANQEHMMDSFNPMWDVTGAEVDVARYLSGEPECMIDFPLTKTSHSGRVITLCASVGYSWAIKAATIQDRGRVIVALALALSRLGHSVEMWADISGENNNGQILRTRILVKGVNDELDPSRVMFAFAHPAMLRVLGWTAREKWGSKYAPDRSHPVPPLEDLPEGTIYLPEIRSSRDVPNADEFLREHLGNLGLLAE